MKCHVKNTLFSCRIRETQKYLIVYLLNEFCMPEILYNGQVSVLRVRSQHIMHLKGSRLDYLVIANKIMQVGERIHMNII